jgi:arginase
MKRISILGVPISLGAGRWGVEAGDRAVRTAKLQQALTALGFDVREEGSLDVPHATNEGNPRARFLAEIAGTCERLAQWQQARLAEGIIPLVIGGDHSIGAGTVAGTAAHYRERNGRIGLVWIDAHGDMNTPDTTPSGNIHGMSVAACIGLGARELTHLRGFAPKVDPRRVVIVGARDIDPGEFELIARHGVRVITMREIDERGMFMCMHEALERALDNTHGVHVSLDMDALDPSIAPGVGTPVLGGLTYREAHLALEMVADSERLVSMDVVEVNPMLDAQNLTAQMAVGLIASGLGKRITPRLR